MVESVLLEEIVGLERPARIDEVEEIGHPEIEEGEEQGNERMTKDTRRMFFAREGRYDDHMHRLVIGSKSCKTRDSRKLKRPRLVSVEERKESESRRGPGMIRNPSDYFDGAELEVGRLVSIDCIAAPYEDPA